MHECFTCIIQLLPHNNQVKKFKHIAVGYSASSHSIWKVQMHSAHCHLIPNSRIENKLFYSQSVQFSLVTQSCLTLCDPMNCSMPGLPVHHQLLESTQTHVHWVGDVIQPSHPLSSPYPPAPSPSQHQGLFQWINSAWGGQSIGVSASASVFPVNTQDWSPLGWTGWISLQSKGLSRVFSNTTVQKH